MIWKQFLSRVRQTPDRCAICLRDRSITYRDLAGMAAALASRSFTGDAQHLQRALIRQSDPLAILLCVLACWHSRVVPMVMRENASDAQLQELMALLRPEYDMSSPLAVDDLAPVDRIDGDSTPWLPRNEALVLSTSGSTGNPKLVALPAESVCLNATTIGASLELTQSDRIAVTTPLTYMYGLMGATMAGLWAGAEVHLFSPQLPLTLVQASIRRHGITVIQGPPSLMKLFMAYWNGQPFPSVRILTMGGEALTQELADDVARAFPQAKRLFLYGMTEAGPRISHDDFGARRFLEGCVGYPYPHIEWRIVPAEDDQLSPLMGRLALRGPTIFLGYLQSDGSYAGLDAEGFFLTNDLVSRDQDGRLCFQGRLDRMFKCGGRLVNPASIERILNQHPDVQQSRCRAEPHDILGFAPVAEVVLRPGRVIHESELKAHCGIHLDSHAVPRRITFVDQFPIAASGKAGR